MMVNALQRESVKFNKVLNSRNFMVFLIQQMKTGA